MTFLGGTYVLAAAAVVSRLLGAFHRVFLYSLLQKEGMGLLQMASPVYFLAMAVCTGGIRTATARLVAEREAQGNHPGANAVFRVSIWLLGLLGFVVSVLMFACSRIVALRLTRDPRTALVIAVLAPGIFFEAVTAAYRGLFQGQQRMMPPAVAQVVEQIVRTGVTFCLVFALLPGGLELATAGAALGTVIGSIAGFCCLLWAKSSRNKAATVERVSHGSPTRAHDRAILQQIAAIALPVSSVGIVLSVLHMVDVAVVPGRLQAMGLSFREATALYGQFTGGALPLVTLPTVITGALQISLVPAITQAQAASDVRRIKRLVNTAIRVTLTLMVPACVGLSVLATEIPLFLYKDPGLGPLLSVLSLTPLLLSLQHASSGVLQGLGRFGVTMRNLLFSALVQLAVTYVSLPIFGIVGAAYGTLAALCVGTLLNLIRMSRDLALRPADWLGLMARPAIAACVMGFVVRQSHDLVYATTGLPAAALVISIGTGALVYALLGRSPGPA